MDFKVSCPECNLTRYYIDHDAKMYSDLLAKIKETKCEGCGKRKLEIKKLKSKQSLVIKDRFPNKRMIITKQKLVDLINASAVWRNSSNPLDPELKEEEDRQKKSDVKWSGEIEIEDKDLEDLE